MFVTKFFWHEASKELPDQSCEVLVACEDRGRIYVVSDVHFSARHKMFNCSDYDETPKNALKDVKYWMYFDEFANTLKTIEKINSK